MSDSADNRLNACYYDPARAAIKLKAAGLITGSKCDTIVANFRTTYRDAYLVANSYNPGAPFFYTTGLAEDFLVNGNAASKAAIASLIAASGFIIGDQSKFSDIHYARECAFALAAQINNFRVGNVGVIDAQAEALKDKAITMLENWVSGTAAYTQFYIRPFMVALITDSLILYDDEIGLTQGEKDQIETTWEHIHSTMWRSGDTHPSLKFTSVRIDAMDPNDPNTDEQQGLYDQNYNEPDNQDGPGDDVSLMHISAYAWLYKEGYGSIWAERANEAFYEGFPHYIYDTGYAGEGDYYHDYGAYIHTIGSNINAKHLWQQLWTFAEFVEYYNAEAATSEEPSEVAGVSIVSGFGGYYGSVEVAAAAYNPSSHLTGGSMQFWFDFSDAAKVLDAGAASASNAEAIATVNPSTGTPTLVTGGSPPVVTTNVTNGKQGATFNGSLALNATSSRGLLNNASKVCFGAVLKLHGTGGNGQFFNCVDSGWNTSRFKPFLATAAPSLDGARTSVGATVNSSTSLVDEEVSAVLWLWDVAAATATIYINDVVTNISASAFSTAGSIENLDSNAGHTITVGSSLDATLFDLFLHTGSLPSSQQVTDWFAAVKTKFGITAY